MLKNNQKVCHQMQKRKQGFGGNHRIINQDNLLVISSTHWENWTDLPKNKKGAVQANSQPITRG